MVAPIRVEIPKNQEIILMIRELGFNPGVDLPQKLLHELWYLCLIAKDAAEGRDEPCFGTFDPNGVCTGSDTAPACALRKVCARMKVIQDAIRAGLQPPRPDEPAPKPAGSTPKVYGPRRKTDPSKLDEFGFRKDTYQSKIAAIIAAGGTKQEVLDKIIGLDVAPTSANVRYHTVRKLLVKNGFIIEETGKGKDKVVKLTRPGA